MDDARFRSGTMVAAAAIMRKLIMWNIITLDGMFEGTRSWDLFHTERIWGAELEQFSIDQLQSADYLVFGRVTYEGMASYWRTAEGRVADYMNKLPKIVVSRTMKSPDWGDTLLVQENVPERLDELKRQGDGNMFVFGSAKLSETLMNEHLFDEYRIGIAPVVAGKGRRLFGDGVNLQDLELIDTRPTSTGCVIVRYQPRAS